MSRQRNYLVYAGFFTWIVSTTILGRAFTVLEPGLYDSQLFAYIGQMWLEGLVPYIDIWDNKPPGIFFITAVAFAITPQSFLIIAVIEGVFIIGCIVTVFAIMREVGGPRSATYLATSVCAIIANYSYYNQGGLLTEIYVLWPSAMSIFLFIKGLRNFSNIYLISSGCFAGIATSFKLTGIAPIFSQLAVILLCFLFGRYTIRAVLIIFSAMLFGFLLSCLPWVFYFYWKGGLSELLGVSFLFPFLYGLASQQDFLMSILALTRRLLHVGGLLIVALAGFLFLTPHIYKLARSFSLGSRRINDAPHNAETAILIILWFGFDFLGVVAGGRYYAHYFLAISASLSVMIGLSYWYVAERAAADQKLFVRVRVLGLIVLFLNLALLQLADVRKIKKLAPKQPDTIPLVAYLNGIKKTGDTLFIWDYKPAIYFQTGLHNAHKLTTALNLQDSPYMLSRFGDDLLTSLEMRTPTYIVDAEKVQPKSRDLSDLYLRFQRLIKDRYELVLVEDRLRLYRRR